ncbi:MAG TPA: tetratricopeptide repeat protein [Bryobacteraceae bacterium]
MLPLLLAARGSSQTAPDFYRLASTQFLQRRFVEAKASFARAIQIDGSYAEAYRGLGMAELELKDYNGAYRAWLKAVELNPKDEKSKYFLGRLFYEADLPNEGAAWLREALALSPDDYEATTYLGLCAEALGLDGTASPLYRNAMVESNAQNKPYSWAYLNLGNFLRKHGDETQALRVLEEGARKCPEAHELAAFGTLLAAHDQLQRAEAVLRQAVALDPGLSQPHYRLGLLLRSTGRSDESKSEMIKFQQAKEQEDRNAKIIALRK